jgi:hypothetical protein
MYMNRPKDGPKQKPSSAERDPAEGSREAVEHELRRRDLKPDNGERQDRSKADRPRSAVAKHRA